MPSRTPCVFGSICLLLAAAVAPTAEKPQQKMSGPFTHENLTIYIVRGPATIQGEYLTLEEALAAKSVIVHETGNVNELTIENRSDRAVFVQSGDIVKGGKQDRTLGTDMVLAPHSKALPIASFCVEHGRWAQRGSESARTFSSASGSVSGLRLKLAGNANYSGAKQEKVWDEVAKSQQKLVENIAPASAAPAQTSVAESARASITGGAGGSYQLTLEDKGVQEAIDQYVQKLKSAATEATDDVVGYVAIVNGKVRGSDIYGSKHLFQKLWPRLLRSAATEAATEKKAGEKFEPLTEEGVRNAMLGAEDGKIQKKEINDRTTVTTIESAKTVLFITQDKAENGELHRSLLPRD